MTTPETTETDPGDVQSRLARLRAKVVAMHEGKRVEGLPKPVKLSRKEFTVIKKKETVNQ